VRLRSCGWRAPPTKKAFAPTANSRERVGPLQHQVNRVRVRVRLRVRLNGYGGARVRFTITPTCVLGSKSKGVPLEAR
jgi:hypothetical protein